MAQVTLNVNGNPYRLACRDGEEEQLQVLGKVLSEQVDAIAASVGQIGDARLILMAALMLMDDAKAGVESAEQAIDDSRAQIDAIRAAAAADIEAVKAATAKIQHIADQLESA